MSELNQAHEALTDGGIPRVDEHGQPHDLVARIVFLLDESNSVRAELNELLESLAP